MSEKKMNDKKAQEKKDKPVPMDLNLDDLDAVQGGGLGNVSYSSTSSISSNTRDNI